MNTTASFYDHVKSGEAKLNDLENEIMRYLINLREDINEATAKEKSLLTILELANEMLERGFKFKMVDIERSDATDWLIDGDTLIAPFRAIPGLGINVAKQIVAAREEKPFLSKQDLSERGKVSKTLIEFMTVNHVLDQLPDENQLFLFDML